MPITYTYKAKVLYQHKTLSQLVAKESITVVSESLDSALQHITTSIAANLPDFEPTCFTIERQPK